MKNKIKIWLAKLCLILFQEEIINIMADEELREATLEAKKAGFDDLAEYVEAQERIKFHGGLL